MINYARVRELIAFLCSKKGLTEKGLGAQSPKPSAPISLSNTFHFRIQINEWQRCECSTMKPDRYLLLLETQHESTFIVEEKKKQIKQ